MRFPYKHGEGRKEKHNKRENATLTHVHVAEHWVGLKVHSLWVEEAPSRASSEPKSWSESSLGQEILYECFSPGRYMLCK